MIAMLRKILASRMARHLPATGVVLVSGDDELILDLTRKDGGRARVALRGALTTSTAEMMARWFVPLRATTLGIELDVERLTRLDRGALQILLQIARGCAFSDVSFRVSTGVGRWREALRPLSPAGLLANADQSSNASSRPSSVVVPAATTTFGITRGSDPSAHATMS